MTLDQLNALKAVVEGGSLKAGAQALNRTQPTISVAIKNLEEELGVEIFARDQYRNRLTPAGQTLYEKAKLILKQVHSFENLGKQLAAGEEAEVGIAFDSSVPVHLILNVIRQCKVEFPRTRLNIYSENVFGALDRLEEGKAAVAIFAWIKDIQKLESIPFMTIRFIPVISAKSPLLKEYQVIPEEVMKEYSQVVIRDSSRNPSKENYGVLEGGDQWRVNDFHTKKEIILQNMGWGYLPEHLIQDELEQGLLVPLKIERFPEHGEASIRVVRLANEAAGPVTRRLWQLFQDNS